MYKIAPIIHVIAKIGFLFCPILLIPALVSLRYHDGVFSAFGSAALITLLLSFAAWLLTIRHRREMRTRDGFTLVFLMWIGFSVLASLPFYLFLPNLSFTDAFFEAISGLTTTGATIFTDLNHLAPSLNFWRHMLNWLGGMGIIVLAVAILPMLGVGGTQLFKAEIPGINKDSKMAPRISQTAKNLWIIYVFFTLITFIALRLAGMGWFDAICHAMSAFSLGGFSTYDNSIAHFNSIAIEIVLSIASIIGAINFTNHFYAFRHKTLRHYWQDEEVRTTLTLLSASIVVIALYLWFKDFYSLGESFRHVGFNVISIALANGYASVDFALWPLVASLWMYFLANILANAGSAGGGIKTIRAIVLFKFSLREMMIMMHPNAVRTVKINGKNISDRIALTVLAFIFVYFMTVVMFTFLLMISGLDFISSMTAVIACITNAGPGLGAVGPAGNYALLSDLQKWLCTAVMLLGRLEIFTVFILFTPAYWRK
ncbi:TrkH family potassium uptake protein [Stenoxybacter acetivorans]|uniref:TrkH family potassium uptake protein n=1 Tax=Stenoxybacter acetivorans TaxID=422441 RepID=UPI00055A55E3|nr:potassium transporter TrkG [Stenoxybacter acetivorans]